MMMYSLPLPLRNDFYTKLRKAILRTVAAVGREIEPATFAHFQPHAHATDKLIRHFAAACAYAGSRRSQLEELAFAAHMHDIGKYCISPDILLKPGVLDEEERQIVSLHSAYGALLISKLPGVTDKIRRIVLYHHEHWDGSGYPEGLTGITIPLEARIVSVVDVYVSLRARRSYKPALSKGEALKGLTEMAGRELDANLVEDFLKLHGEHTRASRF